jgi:hypothetical protein
MKGRGQDEEQKSEARRQESEWKSRIGPKPEGRIKGRGRDKEQETGVRSQNSEGKNQKSEDRRQKSE